ncbi:hypothetical protein Scep_018582 [Stephania cephalantha]|uniref:Uncharacterized protein n=1 Tax=Stephania cephalantha TaxID=152367 RepID=A0AAP0I9J2_9MAGN
MIFHRLKRVISLSISSNSLHRSQNPIFWRPISSKPITVSDFLINRHGFSPETASTVSKTLTLIRNPEKSDSVLSIFKKCGFSNTHIENIVKFVPQILSAHPDKTIKPKIKTFQDLGFAATDIGEIVGNCPWILKLRADNQLGSIGLLKDFVGSNSGVAKVIKRSSWFLSNNLHKSMIPNIDYMKSCGICSTQIGKLLCSVPRLFTFKLDRIKCLVKRVDEMGYDRKSKMFVHAIRVLGSLTEEKWEFKKQVFRGLGWTEDDILFVFRRNPGVFNLSDRKIREIAKYLGDAGGYDSSFLVLHPEMLNYSLEGRIKPRLNVWLVLQSNQLVNGSFPNVCKMRNEDFLKKYVVPFVNMVGKHYSADDGK